jgi:hypothetical protein
MRTTEFVGESSELRCSADCTTVGDAGDAGDAIGKGVWTTPGLATIGPRLRNAVDPPLKRLG